jgi:hypothetical protein
MFSRFYYRCEGAKIDDSFVYNLPSKTGSKFLRLIASYYAAEFSIFRSELNLFELLEIVLKFLGTVLSVSSGIACILYVFIATGLLTASCIKLLNILFLNDFIKVFNFNFRDLLVLKLLRGLIGNCAIAFDEITA